MNANMNVRIEHTINGRGIWSLVRDCANEGEEPGHVGLLGWLGVDSWRDGGYPAGGGMAGKHVRGSGEREGKHLWSVSRSR